MDMMKNNAKKILIIGVAVIVAVTAILIFSSTIITPPIDTPVENLHLSSMEDDISCFNATKGANFNDSIYYVVTDKIALYTQEKFLTEKDLDFQKKNFVQHYVPVFTYLCNNKFNESVWNNSDHRKMLDKIKYLRRLKTEDGKTNVVAGSFISDLSRIEQIIKDYNKAIDVASYSTFYSVSDANTKIQEAENFRTKYPLSNCTDLRNRLATVKDRIGNSHYRKVEVKVLEMANYQRMTETSFNTLMTEVNGKIQEYDNNRVKYGSNARMSQELRTQANQFYRLAKEYYTREEININTNSQWGVMSTPDQSYRAYQSTSNYHRSSTDATMSFTIKGYETFTFYIRSNGERDYDYVMIGKDSRPSIDYNYANTKGIANAGTALYNYRLVTLNNLQKSLSYTIYVVYHKDGSNDHGDDRGYVLIPYPQNN